MNDLLKAWTDVTSWLKSHLGTDPNSTPAIASATTAAENVQTALGAGIPAVANLAVNAALTFVPGGGAFEVLADDFIDAVIAGLLAKKSTGDKPAVNPTPIVA